MSSTEPAVFIVDDDDAMRDALQVLIRSAGMQAQAYSGAEEFLENYVPQRTGCLLLDVRMPGMDGIKLQEKLAAERIDIPIVFISGHGDIPMAVRAMQKGAVDFIAKPFREQVLLDTVRRAIQRDAQRRCRQADRAAVEDRLATLVPREREVLDLVVAGKRNKVIAAELGLSHKTIEYHRGKIMAKMQAESTADLVRMVLAIRGS
ncbi:MAG: response regulator transcription factor [Candidatus Eisenbacteria sp.]|nr:response regulator transcription factor [Candidatus Eisenbacteria bacterium]